MAESTYLIGKGIIEKVFSMKDYISAVENVFREYGEGKVQMPAKKYLTFEKGDLRCMPAYIPSMNIAGVKNVNVHPQNKNLPSVMATITLIDPETGFPLAIMDGTHITNMRTGAAGGVAVKYLAKRNPKSVALIGTGVQAKTQLEAILEVCPLIKEVSLYDSDFSKTQKFVGKIKTSKEYNFDPSTTIGYAIYNADIIVTTTPSRTPLIKLDYIEQGTHINAIGADAEGKQELETEVLKNSKIVIDNWEQASHSGEINVPISKGLIEQKDIYANIGEIVTGKKEGRTSEKEITIFDSTGLAIQDIACANEIYKRIIGDKKLKKELKSIEFF